MEEGDYARPTCRDGSTDESKGDLEEPKLRE